MKIITLILLIIVFSAEAEPFDIGTRLSSGYNPYDHMLASAVMTYGGMELLLKAGDWMGMTFFKNRFHSFIAAALVTISLGWAKEKYIDRYFSHSDMNSNISGITGALVAVNILDLFRRQQ